MYFSKLPVFGITLAVILAVFSPAHAQERADHPWVGKRVRVTAPQFLESRVIGNIGGLTHEGLLLVDEISGEEHRLPLQSIERLDPFRGDSRASTAWYQARFFGFLGGGVGLIAGPFLGSVSPWDMGPTMAASSATGAITGAAVGAVLGALFPRERWGWIVSPWGYDPQLKPSH